MIQILKQGIELGTLSWDLILFLGRADVVASKHSAGKKRIQKGQTQSPKGQGRKVSYSLVLIVFCFSCLPLTPSSRRPLGLAMKRFILSCTRSILKRLIIRSVPLWLTMLKSEGIFLCRSHSLGSYVWAWWLSLLPTLILNSRFLAEPAVRRMWSIHFAPHVLFRLVMLIWDPGCVPQEKAHRSSGFVAMFLTFLGRLIFVHSKTCGRELWAPSPT